MSVNLVDMAAQRPFVRHFWPQLRLCGVKGYDQRGGRPAAARSGNRASDAGVVLCRARGMELALESRVYDSGMRGQYHRLVWDHRWYGPYNGA
jgi:hypothetical protein